MLDSDLWHREVLWIPGREPATKRHRRGCHEAVGLRECAAASCELAPPFSGLPTFFSTERGEAKPGEERTSRPVLARPEPPNSLLDIDCADIRRVIRVTECQQPPSRVGTTAKEVDEDGRVEENGRQLPDSARIRPPLVANPPAEVLVPVMPTVRNRPNRRLEKLPAVVVVQRSFDRSRDVCAASARAHPAVELFDEIVSKRYVHSHGHRLAH